MAKRKPPSQDPDAAPEKGKYDLGALGREIQISETYTYLKGLCDASVNEENFKECSTMDSVDKALLLSIKMLLPKTLDDLICLFEKIPDGQLKSEIVLAFEKFCLACIQVGEYTPPRDFVEQEQKIKNRAAFGSHGGKKSGEKRAKDAEEFWMPHALQLAKTSRTVNKGWSQDDVATYIATNWNLKIKCPGHARLKQVIKQWIDEGKLAKKIR